MDTSSKCSKNTKKLCSRNDGCTWVVANKQGICKVRDIVPVSMLSKIAIKANGMKLVAVENKRSKKK